MKTKQIKYKGHIFDIEECLPDTTTNLVTWWIGDYDQQQKYKQLSGASNCVWILRKNQAFNYTATSNIVAEVVV